MTGAEFAWLADFLRDRSGIALGADKGYLVEARLAPVARRAGAASLSELVARLARRDDLALEASVIEAMTTNETLFFRDGAAFGLIADLVLPELLRARKAARRLRIWCAACSTGQEPYSLAMTLADRASEFAGWRIDIVASDIAPGVVERAKTGLYSQFEVQRGLPIRALLKHFVQDGHDWRISQTLRAAVTFRTVNLTRDFSALGAFDLVLCRNVLIYFDEARRADVLSRIARQLAPDGFLMTGAAETAVAPSSPFRSHEARSGLFVRRAAGPELRLVAAG